MISDREIRVIVSSRAIKQFFRDIKAIQRIVEQNNGVVSILDAMAISARVDEEEAKMHKKSWLSLLTKSEKSNTAELGLKEDSYVYSFLINFMAELELEELRSEDFESLNLREIYMSNYKKDYEAFQEFNFNMIDKPYYTGEIEVIRCKKISEADSEMENC